MGSTVVSLSMILFFSYIGGMLVIKLGQELLLLRWSFFRHVQFSMIFISSFAFRLITRIILGAGEVPSYPLE